MDALSGNGWFGTVTTAPSSLLNACTGGLSNDLQANRAQAQESEVCTCDMLLERNRQRYLALDEPFLH